MLSTVPSDRQRAVDDLGFLGLLLDVERNEGGEGDREIGLVDAVPFCVVVVAREDLQIAREVRRVLSKARHIP